MTQAVSRCVAKMHADGGIGDATPQFAVDEIGKTAKGIAQRRSGEKQIAKIPEVRLVFTAKEGKGIATSLIDLGNRFRLIINTVNCKKIEKPMPKLPVATAFWTPEPNLITGAESWILAGGAHHTAFSYDLTAEQMGDWAEAMGIEAIYIDEKTTIRDLKNELKWNSVVYR